MNKAERILPLAQEILELKERGTLTGAATAEGRGNV
jgi:hypothetical protein